MQKEVQKKSLIRPITSIAVLLIILALFAYYIVKHLADFKSLTLVNPWIIIVLALLVLVSSILTGLVTDSLVAIFGIKLKFKEWFGLSVITTFYNTITPFRGGMAARALYLKQKHNFSYTNFIAALAGTYVIDFFIGSLVGLISLFLIYQESKIFNWFILALFLAFFIPLGIIILFSPEFKETNNKFLNKFVKVLNGWHIIRKNRKMVLVASLRAFLLLMIGTVGSIISYGVFGINISFANALFMTSLGSFAILISITPAGLGIMEAVAVFSALVIGISPSQSLPVALMNRAITMVVIFILGPIFSYILFKRDKR